MKKLILLTLIFSLIFLKQIHLINFVWHDYIIYLIQGRGAHDDTI